MERCTIRLNPRLHRRFPPIHYVPHCIEDIGAFSNGGNFLHHIFSPRLLNMLHVKTKICCYQARFLWAELVSITPVLDVLAICAVTPLDLRPLDT